MGAHIGSDANRYGRSVRQSTGSTVATALRGHSAKWKVSIRDTRTGEGWKFQKLNRFSFRFSVKVLMSLCQQSEGQPLAGVVVIGDGHSARAIALAGSSMGLPVLWAKGGTANLDGMHREVSSASFFFNN